MIFNSISRQLSKSNLNTDYKKPINQNTYFPSNPINMRNSVQYQANSTYLRQTNKSALSKMNEKIAENIQFIRYKDKMRLSQLRSSKVSCSSNKSVRSNRSSNQKSGSLSKYRDYKPQVKLNQSSRMTKQYIPAHHSQIKTFVPQKQYLPQKSSLEGNFWKQSQQKRGIEANYNEQFRYFSRKPITIQSNSKLLATSSQKFRQPERDNSTLQQSYHSNKSDIFSDFHNNKENKLDARQMILQQTKNSQNGQWNSSFANNINQPTKIGQSLKAQDPKSKQVLSPLQKSGKKEGMIVAAGLIALGIIIFLLQILK